MGISGKRFVYYSLVLHTPGKIATNALLKWLENHALPIKSMLSTPPPTGVEAPASEKMNRADIGHWAGDIVGESVQGWLKPLPVLPASVDCDLTIEPARSVFQSVRKQYSIRSRMNSASSLYYAPMPDAYGGQDVSRNSLYN